MSRAVTIYTDGACSGNPGPGGYGVVLLSGSHRKELAGGYRRTTNNRMELRAAIAGLESLRQPSTVQLFTDSRYLVDSMMLGWAKSWQAKGWRRKSGKLINADLWQVLAELCSRHDVKFLWVRGHASDVENERCDVLAVQAAQAPDLPPDAGYDAQMNAGAASPAELYGAMAGTAVIVGDLMLPLDETWEAASPQALHKQINPGD